MYSINEISEWLIAKHFCYKFIPFKIKSIIEEKKDDPIRSYTVPLKDMTNGLISGLDLWIEQYLLLIDMNKTKKF